MKVIVEGKEREVAGGTSLLKLYRQMKEEGAVDSSFPQSPVMAAIVNSQMRELTYVLRKSCTVDFVPLEDQEGTRIYMRSLIFCFVAAVKRVLGENITVRVKHSLHENLYIELFENDEDGKEILRRTSNAEAKALTAALIQIIEENLPINKEHDTLDWALDYFHDAGMSDKERLFTYRSVDSVNLYDLEGMKDYFYGPMVPETGCLLPNQKVITYEDGLILLAPERKPPYDLREFKPMPKLFDIFQESKEWGAIMGISDVGALNDCISSGRASDLIQISEALHAKKVAEIASDIARRGTVKLVLIAGPSSSGKTTFAQKLLVQLRAEGITPHMISMDNYFVNRTNTPVDEDGNPDFECLEAVDTKQFNDDMAALMRGEEVNIPTYNFIKGEREYKGNTIQLRDREILIVEGIHGLNEKVSESVSAENKYKIYISALTLINIDNHNRIPTTDGRLLRRIVRDNAHRGHSAAKTIAMWPSVRKGEDNNIFPFQEGADIVFNSAHIYELAVLKQYVEPLLYCIRPEEPEYVEARRLIKFLDYFLDVPSEYVPTNSLIREFIGGGIYEQ